LLPGESPRPAERPGLRSGCELRQLSFQQSTRPGRRRQKWIEVVPVQMYKIGDGVFHFLLAGAAGPTLQQVRGSLLGASGWKLAIHRQYQLLIGKMRFLRKHIFTVDRRERNAPAIFLTKEIPNRATSPELERFHDRSNLRRAAKGSAGPVRVAPAGQPLIAPAADS